MLSRRPPVIPEGFFTDVNCSVAEAQEINAKYNKLFKYWINSKMVSQSRLGSRYIGPCLRQCTQTPLCIAILADKHDFLSQTLIDQEPNVDDLLKWLYFSFAVGSKNSSSILMDKLSMTLHNLTTEQRQDMLELLGSSGNTEWLKEIMLDSNLLAIPDICYSHPQLSERALKQLSQELESVEHTDSSDCTVSSNEIK